MQINGRRIFARGGNWLPCDLLYGRPRRPFYEHLIRSAAEANYNLFRVWGGGLIDKPEFYELCDRYGIMLFQEFPNAGVRLPETDAALAVAARETRQILPLLMNHPAIVRYGGGNEWYRDAKNSRQMAQLRTDLQRDGSDPALPRSRSRDDRPAPRSVLLRLSAALSDVQHGASPLTGGPDNPIEWTEYGAAGAVERGDAEVDDAGRGPLADPRRQSLLDLAQGVRRLRRGQLDGFGRSICGCSANCPTWRRRCVAASSCKPRRLRYANQAMRRFRWHRSACAIWTYNEPWPNAAHGCIIEYSGRPKMAYYYTKQAYAPVDILAVYSSLACEIGKPLAVDIWATQDGLEELRDYKCRYRIFSLRGDLLAEKTQTCNLPPESSGKQLSVDWTPPAGMAGDVALLWLELLDSTGRPAARNLYTFGIQRGAAPQPAQPPLAGLLKAPPTKLKASLGGWHKDANGDIRTDVEVQNTGAFPALFVKLDVKASSDRRCLP